MDAACLVESRQSAAPYPGAFPLRPPNFDRKFDRRKKSGDSGADIFSAPAKSDIWRDVAMAGRRERNLSASAGSVGSVGRWRRAPLLSTRMRCGVAKPCVTALGLVRRCHLLRRFRFPVGSRTVLARLLRLLRFFRSASFVVAIFSLISVSPYVPPLSVPCFCVRFAFSPTQVPLSALYIPFVVNYCLGSMLL